MGKSDERRKAVKLPLGKEGEFFVGGWGQNKETPVVDYNSPPSTQPGLWCGWQITEDGQGIRWNAPQTSGSPTEWIRYIIENFLKRWGYTLNGTVYWRGQEFDDLGRIEVKDNVVTEHRMEWRS